MALSARKRSKQDVLDSPPAPKRLCRQGSDAFEFESDLEWESSQQSRRSQGKDDGEKENDGFEFSDFSQFSQVSERTSPSRPHSSPAPLELSQTCSNVCERISPVKLSTELSNSNSNSRGKPIDWDLEFENSQLETERVRREEDTCWAIPTQRAAKTDYDGHWNDSVWDADKERVQQARELLADGKVGHWSAKVLRVSARRVRSNVQREDRQWTRVRGVVVSLGAQEGLVLNRPVTVWICKDSWKNADVQPGDAFNLVLFKGASELEAVVRFLCEQTRFELTESSNIFLVTHPDTLLPSGCVASATECPRAAVLSRRYRLTDPLEGKKPVAAVNGSLAHALLQEAMTYRRFDLDSLYRFSRRVVKELQRDLVACDIAESEALEFLESLFPSIRAVFQSYIERETAVRWPCDNKKPSLLAIDHVLDIEEVMASPRFAVRGVADLSVVSTGSDLMPIEVKTGRPGMQHRAQALVYALLMGERYGTDVDSALLLYLRKGDELSMQAHQVHASDMRYLLSLRNQVARHVDLRAQLAQQIRSNFDDEDQVSVEQVERDLDRALVSLRRHSSDDRVLDSMQTVLQRPFPLPARPPGVDCKSCFQRRQCALFNRAVESEPLSQKARNGDDVFQSALQHGVSPRHLEYFRRFALLLDLEEQVDQLAQSGEGAESELWTLTSKARARTGRCIENLVISSETRVRRDLRDLDDATEDSECFFVYRMRKRGANREIDTRAIGCNARVHISTMDGRFQLLEGTVVAQTSDYIDVSVSRFLKEYRREKELAQLSQIPMSLLLRLDTVTKGHSIVSQRDNLMRVVLGESERMRRWRSLIVDDTAVEAVSDCDDCFREEVGMSLESLFDLSLNDDQRAAVTAVFNSKNLTLLVGMPGTGKTTTIAFLARALVSAGLRVLVTAYTHSAVDNVLHKIVYSDKDMDEGEINVVRIGYLQSVAPSIHPFVLTGREEDLRKRWKTADVVGVTCLSLGNSLIQSASFDVCIVDEAAQLTEPLCLAPLSCASRVVLVGDHMQLPPLVKSRRAQELGLSKSLFERLACLPRMKEAVVELRTQYRMNSEIMSLSNALVYQERLRCGSAQVAAQRLDLSAGHRGDTASDSDTVFLDTVLSAANPVVFVDTRGHCRDSTEQASDGAASSRTRTVNPREAYLVSHNFSSCCLSRVLRNT
ncbi:MAG: hypothetical protein MHM6MM_006259, partial [Cercozoa sp. M6MM]